MSPKFISIAVFAVSYVLFVILPKRRSIVAVAAAALLILLGAVTFRQAAMAINWNVMGIFVGTLIIADIFMESRVPAYLAELIVDLSRSTAWAVLFICIMTSFISAFVENVATVLIVAPIALSLSKKLKISPVGIMIAIAVSSNLQGTATLIGDPPSMLLGGFAKMNFMDFFFYKGRPSIFFAVQAGAFASFLVLYFIFRNFRQKIKLELTEKVETWAPTLILVLLIVCLALSSFFDTGFSYLAGILCMVFGVASLIWKKILWKRPVLDGIRSLDWDTTFFLMGIFVIVGSVSLTGWLDMLSSALSGVIGNNIFMGYTLLVVIAVVISAFVDNVPFLVAMLPVAISMADKLAISPTLFLFGLLIGASLGGNITPIGASANIVACGLLKKEGHDVHFREFAKIGLPFTLAAVFAAYVFVWTFWKS